MLTLLSEKETAVERAVCRVLETVAQIKVEPNLWEDKQVQGVLDQIFQQAKTPSDLALGMNVGSVSNAALGWLKTESSYSNCSLLLFGSRAETAAADQHLIENIKGGVRGEKTLRLASLLAAASVGVSKARPPVEFFADCHILKSQLLTEMNAAGALALRCGKALRQLEGFLIAHELKPNDSGDIASFFQRLHALLSQGIEQKDDAADEATQTERAILERTIRDYCAALRTPQDIKQMINSFRRVMGVTATNIGQGGRETGRGRMQDDEVSEFSDRICVSVLVVEDDPVQAERLLKGFKPYCYSVESYKIEFLSHTPEPGETQVKFAKRLEKRICCESRRPDDEVLPRLHAVIMDYAIDLPMGDKRINGVDLSREIKRWRPGVEVFLMTGKEIYDVVEEAHGIFARPFWKHDSLFEHDELFLALVATLKAKYRAPFWEALKEFAAMPVATYHAMALAHGRSAKKSPVLADFLEFYSNNYFMAETSATMEPLDSLLHPVGSIKKAQQRAAHAFGAKQTRFVTNGTSTANKIVLQSLLQPGDSILIDRNCHISHHYGLVLSDARPYYLEPEHLNDFGISGGVTLETIKTELQKRIDAGDLPKAILLTNCTFDGIICQPYEVIKMVRAMLLGEAFQKIVFLFDEAWFAYARFHPRYIQFTGMATAARLCTQGGEEDKKFYRENLRVYVTQSTHKTLSAFRQASMIHIWDPVLETDHIAALRFEEAFLTHTSTSPHSGILASLDVARRQMELEGCALIDEALHLAEEFRANFDKKREGQEKADWERITNLFDVLDAGKMNVKPLPKSDDRLDPNDLILDPTKLTLHLKTAKGAFTGAELKKHLLTQHNIQINKNSDNTVLLMIHAGATKSSTVYPKQVLMHLADEIEERARQQLDLADEDDFGNDEAENAIESSNPVPHFSKFTDAGRPQEHNMASYFHSISDQTTKWKSLKKIEQEIAASPENYKPYISATFVNPYPPGYPILVPGQTIEEETVTYLRKLGTKEIHGTRPHAKDKDDILILVFKSQVEATKASPAE